MKSNIRLKFWGVRGSIPTAGAATIAFGGNTACLEVRCGDELFIVDAGSGIRELGTAINGAPDFRAHLFFTHYHWDHILGFPFFTPLYRPDTQLIIYGEDRRGRSVQQILSEQMVYPYFPVPLSSVKGELRFKKIHPGITMEIGECKISTHELNHPFGALGYRFEYGGSTLVTVFDHEHTPDLDPALVDFARGADILVYDAAYTPEEYETSRRGWGHSTYTEAARLGRAGGVPKVFLFHHDPTHDDTFMTGLEATARAYDNILIAAREGDELTF